MTKNVVVIGKPGAGKTSLIHKLTGLSKELMPTVGPEVYALKRDDVVVHVWDTPGQDKYSSISKGLVASAALVLACSEDGTWVETPRGTPELRVRTKDDLNRPWFAADLATSALSGAGVRGLFDAIFCLVSAPPVVGGSGCCGWGCSAVATHTTVDQYRLDLITNAPQLKSEKACLP